MTQNEMPDWEKYHKNVAIEACEKLARIYRNQCPNRGNGQLKPDVLEDAAIFMKSDQARTAHIEQEIGEVVDDLEVLSTDASLGTENISISLEGYAETINKSIKKLKGLKNEWRI